MQLVSVPFLVAVTTFSDDKQPLHYPKPGRTQGAYRMRGINRGQRVVVYAIPEVVALVTAFVVIILNHVKEHMKHDDDNSHDDNRPPSSNTDVRRGGNSRGRNRKQQEWTSSSGSHRRRICVLVDQSQRLPHPSYSECLRCEKRRT